MGARARSYLTDEGGRRGREHCRRSNQLWPKGAKEKGGDPLSGFTFKSPILSQDRHFNR